MPRNRVLVIEDDAAFRALIVLFFQGKGWEVLNAGTCAEAERLWTTTTPDAVVVDHNLPDGNSLDLTARIKAFDATIPIIILTAEVSIDLAVEAVKLGAEQFLTKPTDLSVLYLVTERCVENQRLRLNQMAEKHRQTREEVDPFVGRSSIIRKLAEVCNKIVLSDSPLLIQGETGTGKGVLAHWFHSHGPRTSDPFVDLNCAGLSRELLESELFGYEKGAFTGAVQSKAGLLEIAHRGTVFLDEIGDMDLQVQPRLLKVLEEQKFRRLGDVRDRRINIRLIAATHHEIARLVRENLFRRDLFFRINIIPLVAPPLRERVEDIPLLANRFLRRMAVTVGATATPELSEGALRALQSYSWPGNIRELRNVLERAVLLSDGALLTESDLHFDVSPETRIARHTRTLEELEREYIEEVLVQEGGRVESAAKRLGLPRSSLYHKIRQYGIERGHLDSPATHRSAS